MKRLGQLCSWCLIAAMVTAPVAAAGVAAVSARTAQATAQSPLGPYLQAVWHKTFVAASWMGQQLQHFQSEVCIRVARGASVVRLEAHTATSLL